MPDHKRGYVQRRKGVLAADPGMARRYEQRAGFGRVVWDEEIKGVVLRACRRVCDHPDRAEWRLHGAVVVFNHLHFVVSWKGGAIAAASSPRGGGGTRRGTRSDDAAARSAARVLHRAVTVDVRDALGWGAGRPVLSRGGDRKRVRDAGHLEYLLAAYLPRHLRYGGVLYVEWGGD